jgi:20S proteasome alpha/beta subunit
MTVCIAAACRDGGFKGEPKIVLCADRKSSTMLGSAETADKVQYLCHGCRCLTAGTESDIIALVRLYKKIFDDEGNRSATNIDSSIKEPLFRRRHDLATEYIRNRFLMSVDEFMKHGKERLPTELFYDATQKLSAIDLNADLIVAGFIDGAPEIYSTDSFGVARASNHFAVVGEGAYLASASLLRREQHDYSGLEETLYNVFEAKKLSESIGSVGKQTWISVLHHDGSSNITSREVDKELESWYEEYRPKKVRRDRKFNGKYYYTRADPVTP